MMTIKQPIIFLYFMHNNLLFLIALLIQYQNCSLYVFYHLSLSYSTHWLIFHNRFFPSH